MAGFGLGSGSGRELSVSKESRSELSRAISEAKRLTSVLTKSDFAVEDCWISGQAGSALDPRRVRVIGDGPISQEPTANTKSPKTKINTAACILLTGDTKVRMDEEKWTEQAM